MQYSNSNQPNLNRERPPLPGRFNPNQHPQAAPAAPPSTASIISDEDKAKFNKSEQWLSWLSWAGKIFVIFFTLPHNLSAFAMGKEVTFWQLFEMSTLGVFVIELSWLTTMIHFSHGWLSHKKQATAAYISLTFTTGVLIANAITSHLAHYIANGTITNPTAKLIFVDIYGSFILPSTPILCVLAIGFLISYHPKIEQVAKSFQFMVQENALSRDAVMSRALASNKLQAQRLLSSGTKLMAELKAEEIQANADAQRIESQALQEAALLDFDRQRLLKTMDIQKTVMYEILDSAEFKDTLTQVEKNNIYAMLGDIYPGFVPPAGVNQPAKPEQKQEQQPAIEQQPAEVKPVAPAILTTPSANGHSHFVPAVAKTGGSDGEIDPPLAE